MSGKKAAKYDKTRPYTLPLSRGLVGRSGIAKKRSHFVLVTDRPTRRVLESRVRDKKTGLEPEVKTDFPSLFYYPPSDKKFILAETDVSTLNTRELYHCLGQSIDDLILKCSFGDKTCDLELDFVPVVTDAGQCFTFNHNNTHVSNSTGE